MFLKIQIAFNSWTNASNREQYILFFLYFTSQSVAISNTFGQNNSSVWPSSVECNLTFSVFDVFYQPGMDWSLCFFFNLSPPGNLLVWHAHPVSSNSKTVAWVRFSNFPNWTHLNDHRTSIQKFHLCVIYPVDQLEIIFTVCWPHALFLLLPSPAPHILRKAPKCLKSIIPEPRRFFSLCKFSYHFHLLFHIIEFM